MSILKRFDVQQLNVPGAELITSPVYKDHRGGLCEVFHCLKIDTECSVSSVQGIYPHMNEVYGPIATDGNEILYMIRGKVFCALVDPKNTKTVDILELVPGKVVRIPSGVIRAFVGLEENSIFDIVRTSGTGDNQYFSLTDPEVAGITWPNTGVELKQAELWAKPKTAPAPRPDFAIMGCNGLIGNSFVREIEKRGLTWAPIRARLHQHERIRNEIQSINPRISVVIAAGLGTRPNANWCDQHHLETIDGNVTSQLAIIKMCKELNKHCTIITSAGFYSYDKDHPIGGKGFTEKDPGNHPYNFYYKMRVLLEKMIHMAGYDDSVLILRANLPVDHLIKPASLIGKLLRFKVINSIPSSITVLPSIVPLTIEMMEKKVTGVVNWVCNGTISNGDILRTYQKIVDPNFTFNEKVLTEQESWDAGNAAGYVIPERMLQIFGEDRVPKINDAVDHLINLIKLEKEKQQQ